MYAWVVHDPVQSNNVTFSVLLHECSLRRVRRVSSKLQTSENSNERRGIRSASKLI